MWRNKQSEVESTLPEVQACAAFAVGSYNTFSKDPYLYVIAKFNSVTMANIGGGEYDMEVELGKTNCLKASHTDSSSCKISPEAKVVHCHFVVLSAPWKHERFLISSSCT
ncbi:hypothetical protein SKAU_G00239440 [Synaphobranchus kaupii]|uniref:Cystatin domain-containing protein n=1 Tax=Synaphobranchus kaupii TaxID=118154 RepID=A0A9Q1F7B4_SYNKA|nr:hypothetical protein SKAU_G00239440 [Synaphobranchus kaupii]